MVRGGVDEVKDDCPGLGPFDVFGVVDGGISVDVGDCCRAVDEDTPVYVL